MSHLLELPCVDVLVHSIHAHLTLSEIASLQRTSHAVRSLCLAALRLKESVEFDAPTRGALSRQIQSAVDHCRSPQVLKFSSRAAALPSLVDRAWQSLGKRLQVVLALPRLGDEVFVPHSADFSRALVSKHRLCTLAACAPNLRVLDVGAELVANCDALGMLAERCAGLQAFRAIGAAASRKGLLKFIQLPELRVLHLGYLGMHDSPNGRIADAWNDYLLATCPQNDAPAGAVAAAVRPLKLRHLVLRSTELLDRDTSIIARVAPGLRSLHISSHQVTDDGFRSLIRAAPRHLVSLALGTTSITARCLRLLSDLRILPKLRCVDTRSSKVDSPSSILVLGLRAARPQVRCLTNECSKNVVEESEMTFLRACRESSIVMTPQRG